MTLPKKNREEARQSNALSSAAYSLPRNSKRLIYQCLEQLADYSKLEKNDEEDGYAVVIDHKEYKELFGQKQHVARDIAAGAKALKTGSIVVFAPDDDSIENKDWADKGWTDKSWINGIKHSPREGKTTLFFSTFIVKSLKLDKGTPFTKYLLKNVVNLKSQYSMRLYESICQWRTTRDNLVLDIAWIRARYCLPKSYTRLADFRDKFLWVAVNEISEKTDITITNVEELCRGKRKNSPTHIKLTWITKNTDKPKINKEKVFNLVEPSIDQAVNTYSALINREYLPSKAELDNLKLFMSDLMIEGFDFGGEFADAYKQALDNLAD